MSDPVVMIVEDDDGVRENLCDFVGVHHPGVRCVAVASAEEALARVADAPPDLVLMDLGLPGMSGAEATRRITAASPGSRVVIVSIHDTAAHRAAAAAAGAVGYVAKASFVSELRPLLARLLVSPAGQGS